MAKQILIVDDDAITRELTRRWLNRAGYTCLEALDAEEACDIAISEQPELIIMDCYLLRGSGIEATLWLKNNDRTHHIPILGLTSDPYARRNFLEAGAEDQLTKPVGQHVFLLKVETLLHNSMPML